MDLSPIVQSPPTAYYIPNFITEREEKYLRDEVYRSPKTKWTVLSNRRLQNWGGIPQLKGMVQEPLPKWLQDYCARVANLGMFRDHFPNHVLVNEYMPGQGIMPHEDGPLYYRTVSTISLGSHTILDFYDLQHDDSSRIAKPKFSFLLERRSLLILQDAMYTSHMHGISESTTDILNKDFIRNLDHLGDQTLMDSIKNGDVALERDARVSLTIRNVPKTVKIKLQIGKKF